MNTRLISILHMGLLAYILSMYSLGLGLLLQDRWGLNGLGLLLLVHSLVLSATATHELIHDNFFKSRRINRWAGRLMTHLNGACYVPYIDLVQHHMNHHVYHADFLPFDIAETVRAWPRPIYQLGLFLEWAYFPFLEFVLRWRLIMLGLRDPDKSYWRGWTLLMLCCRGSLFAVLGWLSPRALLLYGVAYVCFVNLMRFVDAFHHTYDYVVMGTTIPKRDRTYEQVHTYSNIVSLRYPWLNLLYLNFGYHNAHHHDMRCPWYRLPKLNHKLYGEQDQRLMPLPQLIGNYHRFRLERLSGSQGVVSGTEEAFLAGFTGGIGVSFLTPP